MCSSTVSASMHMHIQRHKNTKLKKAYVHPCKIVQLHVNSDNIFDWFGDQELPKS